MSTENVTLTELAGSRAARALALDDQLDSLEPGTEEYERVVKSQSVMYGDVKEMCKLAADIDADTRKNRTALLKAGIGAFGVALAAAIKWMFWKQDVEENKKGNYQDRDVKNGASELEKTVKEGFDRVKNEFS